MSSKIKMTKNLWELVLTDSLDVKNIKIKSFRQIGKDNCRFGTWDAIEPSSRYFKSLLYSSAENLDKAILKSNLFLGLESSNKKNGDGIRYYLKNIKRQNLGNPPTVNYFNNEVSIDYLLSAEEIFFLDEKLNKSKIVMEIGAGFGRLAHSIVQNFKNIERYIIVDLDPVLELSKLYLSKVLNKKELSKIDFISSNDVLTIQGLKGIKSIDISINVDSFQEMEESVVFNYLDFISKNSVYFYSKNAIGKYHPDSVDIQLKNKTHIDSALSMGLCKDIIDIFDSNAIQKARSIYLSKYCPRSFEISKKESCFGQYLYYYSALYKHK
jgi:putative sugar O-methyltransferase